MQKLKLISAVVLGFPSAVDAQWTYATSGTTAELRGLSAVTERVVWASGARGTVVRSFDGGITWHADTVSGHTTLDFRAVHAFKNGTAFIASAGEAEKGLAAILATRDGGRHWSSVYSTTTKGVFLDAIAFWDARHGIALSDPVDGRFFILRTGDAGHTWVGIPPERLPDNLAGEAAFAASGSSIALRGHSDVWIGTGGGGRARAMRSRDRGHSWSVVDVPVHAEGGAAGIFSVSFFDRKRGIAVGGDYTKPRLATTSVALTDDGGDSWRPAKSPPPAYLSGVAYAGDVRDVVAVGLAGTFISRDGGDSWTHTDTIPMNSVRFHRRAGFAVGPQGRVARMKGVAP